MRTIAWLTRKDVPYSLTITAELLQEGLRLDIWVGKPQMRSWVGSHVIELEKLAEILEGQPKVIKLGSLQLKPNPNGGLARARFEHVLLGKWRGVAVLGELAELILQATLTET
jgi:hypothetical protein